MLAIPELQVEKLFYLACSDELLQVLPKLLPTEIVDGHGLSPSLNKTASHEQAEKTYRRKVDEQKNRLGITTRMKFVLKDRNRFKDMIGRLKLYNDWLLQYCSNEDTKRFERAYQNLVEGQNDPERLRLRRKLGGRNGDL